MTATDEPATDSYPYRPSSDLLEWIDRNLNWEDVTPGELRCLWVMERHLAECGNRIYHVPQFNAGLTPRRLGFDGISFPALHEVSSYDGSGLAALTVAAYAAAVRVSLAAQPTYSDPAVEESAPRYWEASEVPRRRFVLSDRDGNLVDRFDTAEEREEYIGGDVESYVLTEDDGGRTEYGEPEEGLHTWPTLVVRLHAREHDEARPGMRFYERHPGVGYLRSMIDRLTLPTGPVGTPERSWRDVVDQAVTALVENGPKYPETGQPRPTCVVVRGCPQDIIDEANRGDRLRYSAYRFAASDDDVRPHEVHITYNGGTPP